jgi:hypothetical protein
VSITTTTGSGDHPLDLVDPYKGKWSTLSNTTIGMLMASIDSSIVLISLPDIFRGIKLDPLTPATPATSCG